LDESSFIQKIKVHIKVIEKDFVFSDEGSTDATIQIDATALPQTFNFEVKIEER